MRSKLMAQWISELESGKHEQGRGKLEKHGSYCCLGIAARFVLNLERDSGTGCGAVRYDGNMSTLTTRAAHRLGLDVKQIDMLIDMNDSGKSFDDIAERLRDWFPE
jgi:hypothetical protein